MANVGVNKVKSRYLEVVGTIFNLNHFVLRVIWTYEKSPHNHYSIRFDKTFLIQIDFRLKQDFACIRIYLSSRYRSSPVAHYTNTYLKLNRLNPPVDNVLNDSAAIRVTVR